VSAEANQRFDDLLIKTANLLVKRITNGELYSIDLLGALLWWSAWFNVPLPARAVGVLLVWDKHYRPPWVLIYQAVSAMWRQARLHLLRSCAQGGMEPSIVGNEVTPGRVVRMAWAAAVFGQEDMPMVRTAVRNISRDNSVLSVDEKALLFQVCGTDQEVCMDVWIMVIWLVCRFHCFFKALSAIRSGRRT
jgi:hypothetical protein